MSRRRGDLSAAPSARRDVELWASVAYLSPEKRITRDTDLETKGV